MRLLTNSTGNITDTYEYDAFGNQISSTGSTPNEFLYRGEQWDPDLSLYYLRARYYNPVTGRFMSQDSYGGEVHDPASLHRYRYANGNPANFVDPSGNDAASELAFNIGYRFGQQVGEAAELGAGILCIYNAEAAGIDLVNHWISDTRVQKAMRITTLGLTAAGCAAIIKGIGGPPEIEPLEPGPDSSEFSPTICPMCFAAGTPVHTEHGEEPIEKLKVGERVYALDRATGKTELEPITALVPKHKGNLVELKIQGEGETMRPSVRHPFWVKLSDADKGHWIEAANLRKGELLETIAGKWSKIEAVVPVKQEETVYNFTVANDHDYFVGKAGFLVHNDDCDCGTRRAAFRMAKRALGIAMSTVPQVFGPNSPQFRQFGLNPSQNGRLYIFNGEGGQQFGIREDWPAEYPAGPSQGPHFNYGPFDPENPKSLSGHCYFGED